MSPPDEVSPDRVLVLTPAGQDAAMVRARLLAAGLACEVCKDLGALLASMERPAGAALIAKEALGGGGGSALLAALSAQESWSDLPVLLLTEPGREALLHSPDASLFERANVTFLPRPLRVSLLVGTLRAAVRARRRQYETRDLLRRLQRELQLSELFVSILGHDLRNPLGAIRLSADLLLHLPDPRAQRPGARILAATDRMTRMIEQILDLARIRHGQGIPFNPQAANLGAIGRAVVQELEIAQPHARLRLHEHGDLTGVWDADRLAQVASNLVANAVQHGANGTWVEVTLDGSLPGRVTMRVHNEGCIPPEMLPSLFQPFKESGSTERGRATRRAGLGLGLFIAREIVRAHGGDIVVQSSPEEGTTFEVLLPRLRMHAEMAPASLI